MGTPVIQVYGIRHHGPGSARAVVAALERFRPDCVLIEGPPDADAVIPLCRHAQMQPPVALLIYAGEDPRRSAFYPFAHFSPEWNALRWAVEHQCQVRFMDLPQRHRLAISKRDEEAEEQQAASRPDAAEDHGADNDQAPPQRQGRPDPIRLLAHAAGIEDPERFWEILVEQRQDAADVFPAIREAMAAVRAEVGEDSDPIEALREAWMRTTIRDASASRERIAVICGAWHAPAIDGDHAKTAAGDKKLLTGLPVLATNATWVPWSQERLAFASGYGAGVESPGWYEHLWTVGDRVSERWLVRVARLLRDNGLDCSSAHIIEATRLATCLASLRDQSQPRLGDLDEAVRSVFCFGAEGPLALIHRQLVVGTAFGQVPEDTPAVPVQADLERLCKRLRLARETLAKTLEFDLRQDTDRERSRLLHRLRLLQIPWGEPAAVSGRGTFKEGWTLTWKPEFVVPLIAAGRLGATVEDASAASAADEARTATTLPALAGLLDRVLIAELPQVADAVLARLGAIAAVASDAAALMDAIPPLARTARYGDVRGTDTAAVQKVLLGIVERAAIGLPSACASLDDDAAGTMRDRLVSVSDSLSTLERADLLTIWRTALGQLADRDTAHGVVVGRAVRLLLDQGILTSEQAGLRFGRALSLGNDPAKAAAWFEGFLAASGTALLHDDTLFAIIDAWLMSLRDEAFFTALPAIRRTTSTFQPAERRQIGERVKSGASASVPSPVGGAIDRERADAALPLLTTILGLGAKP
jgi:hypothetical protein